MTPELERAARAAVAQLENCDSWRGTIDVMPMVTATLTAALTDPSYGLVAFVAQAMMLPSSSAGSLQYQYARAAIVALRSKLIGEG